MAEQGLLLLGGGGHCLSAVEVLEAAGACIAGIVHGPDCDFSPVLCYPALGRDADLPRLRESHAAALVTVGQVKSPAVRIRLWQSIKELAFISPVIIAPSAVVSRHARVEAGTVVFHQAMVNTGATVGENCIINTKALIEHGCVIGNHCHVAVGAALCGEVRLGNGVFIGAGAVIHPGVSIGDNAVIGMGAKIFHDVKAGECHVG